MAEQPTLARALGGRPIKKVTAKVHSFSSVRPSPEKGSSDLDQLGKAMTALGSVAGKFLEAKLDSRSKEDIARGRHIANKHRFELMQKDASALRVAEKNGWISNGARPDVKRGFLTQLGVNWAKSSEVSILFDDGVEDLLQEHALNLGSVEDLNQKLDQHFNGKMQEALGALNNNYYSRTIGFSQSINPILERKKEIFVGIYEKLLSKANADEIDKTLTSFMQEGDYKDAIAWFSNGSVGEDSEYEHLYRQIPPRLTTPTEVSPKKFFFDSFKRHILYNRVTSPLHPSYETSLEAAIATVNSVRKLKMPNTGERMDVGSMGEHYAELHLELVVKLNRARGSAAAKEKEIGDSVKDKIQHIFRMASGKGGSHPGLVYYIEGREGELLPITITPNNLVQFYNDLRNNRIRIPTGTKRDSKTGLDPASAAVPHRKVFWDISKLTDPKDIEAAKNDSFTPTPEEFDHVTEFLATKALADVSAEIVTNNKSLLAGVTQMREMDKKRLATRQQRLVDQIHKIFRTKKDPESLTKKRGPWEKVLGDRPRVEALFKDLRWDEDDIYRWVSELTKDLEQEYKSNDLYWSPTQFSAQLKETFNKIEQEKYFDRDKQTKIEEAYDYYQENAEKFFGMDESQIRLKVAALMGPTVGINDPNVTQLVTTLKGQRRNWMSMSTFRPGTEAAAIKTQMKRMILQREPLLQALLVEERKKPHGVGATDHFSMADIMMDLLIERYLMEHYLPTLETMAQAVNMDVDAIRKQDLDAILYDDDKSRRDEMLTMEFTNDAGETVTKEIRQGSIFYNLFRNYGDGHKTWHDRIKNTLLNLGGGQK